MILNNIFCSEALYFYSSSKNNTSMKEGSNCVKENTVRRNIAIFSVNFNNTFFKEIHYFYNICADGKKYFFQPLIK